uniref:Uncharacterized protein n=1 Tax=Eutreptiella gymnastica TaxID=73025 RepID=A0A7S1J2D4_9EUGL
MRVLATMDAWQRLAAPGQLPTPYGAAYTVLKGSVQQQWPQLYQSGLAQIYVLQPERDRTLHQVLMEIQRRQGLGVAFVAPFTQDKNSTHSNRVVNNLKLALKAVVSGRVDCLFVDEKLLINASACSVNSTSCASQTWVPWVQHSHAATPPPP